MCGEILPESEFEDGDGELCGNCRRAAQHFFRLFLGEDGSPRAEANYLNKVYEARLGEGIERFVLYYGYWHERTEQDILE